MLTKGKIAEVLRNEYPHLAVEYGVKQIGLFGSYAKGIPNEASDVDLVVEFDRPIGFQFIEFTEYLEWLLGKKVDILTRAGVQGIRIARVARDIEGGQHCLCLNNESRIAYRIFRKRCGEGDP